MKIYFHNHMSVLIHKSNPTEEKLLLLLVYPFLYIFAIFYSSSWTERKDIWSNKNEGRMDGWMEILKVIFGNCLSQNVYFFVISKLFSFPFLFFFFNVDSNKWLVWQICHTSNAAVLNFFLTRNRFNAIHTWWCHTLWLVASYFSIIYDLYVRITSRIGARHNGHTPPLIPPRQCFIAQS